MTAIQGNYEADMQRIASLERQLATAFAQTASEVDHMECFDQEQRAEIYTILQTLKSGTQEHVELVGRWVSHRGEADA